MNHKSEINLIRKIIELPSVVAYSGEQLEPHHIAYYAFDLARLLQKFYEECRVISVEKGSSELTASRLKLVEASRITFAKTLLIMGMNAPENM